ncbi:MAG: hypothetical protein ABSA65_12655 [Acidimicrobiales bacterium]|jgi:hypothetical protein
MVTGPDWQGDVAEAVLGIGGVVVAPVVATVDEATLGLAASISVIATVATTTSLPTDGIMHPSSVVRGSRNGRLDAGLRERIVTV